MSLDILSRHVDIPPPARRPILFAALELAAAAYQSRPQVIRRRGPWKGIEDVELATLAWIAWYNSTRLLEPLGYVPPIEFEEA